MGSSMQQYCLRWNNHRSNLLLVFEHLYHTEAFTDVTLASDGTSVKCHKIVLAACSSFFQHLFMENPKRDPIIILKDIKFTEIRAILDYMYKGEVNVAQDQLAGLLKAAETLKVKGLVEDHQRIVGSPTPSQPSQRSPFPSSQPPQSTPDYHPAAAVTAFPKTNSIPAKFIPNDSMYDSPYNASYASASSSNLPDRNALQFPLWTANKPLSLSPSPQHGLSSSSSSHHNTNNTNNNYESSQSEPVPLKKKKFYNATKDTPILRTVLGHTPFHTNSEPQYKSINYSLTSSPPNGPIELNDKGHMDSPDHFMDESIRSVDSDKVHEDNHLFKLDMDDKNGLGYASSQKPEWKRYKQYTRTDIMAAIDAVRGGMSALQAARKFGVPSRTLYDKVKKLGIATNRPYRKGSFPMSPYQGLKMEESSGFSPEEPLDISATGNGNGNNSLHGLEMDSDKMDSDPGSSIKQENSPPDEKDYSNHANEVHAENGSENFSSTPPRDRDPSENDEMRSGSD